VNEKYRWLKEDPDGEAPEEELEED